MILSRSSGGKRWIKDSGDSGDSGVRSGEDEDDDEELMAGVVDVAGIS